MATPLRFHLDEHVSPAVVTGLRLRGVDVTTTVEAGLLSASDGEHLEFARLQGRVIVSHDHHFAELHNADAEHAGIAYCYQGKYSVGELVRVLLLMRDCLDSEEMNGTLEYL
jgi:predicted nuclease of predicted toxin-antitoxin system